MSFHRNTKTMSGYAKLAATLLLSTALLSACAKKEEVKAPDAIRPAKLVQIAASSNVISISLPAIIEATDSSDLTFQVGGQLRQLLVVSGQRVSKGTVIGRLDQRDYLNQVSEAKTAFDNAVIELKRAQRLVAAGAISRSDVDSRQATVDTARAQLDTANKSLGDTVLRSPFSGIIATVSTKQFQNVQAGEAIVTLQSTGAAEALVHIPASVVAKSDSSDSVETVIVLDAAPDVRIPATFKSISTQADANTQTFATKFSFLPPVGLTILPGMTGTLDSTTTVKEVGGVKRIDVPLGAVMADGETHYVWSVDLETMKVSRKNIVIGASIGEMLEVSTGLAAGDTIVGAGAPYLHEGMQIRRYEDK